MFWTHLRFTTRMYLKDRALSLGLVTAIALGVGATSAVFAVLKSVVLRPLPHPAVESLVNIYRIGPGGWSTAPQSMADFLDFRETVPAFSSMAAYQQRSLSLVDSAGARRVSSTRVTTDFFQVLDTRPSLGRLFAPGDDEPGRNRVAVISTSLWRRLGGTPDILDAVVKLDADAYRIVGVLPPEFEFYPETEVWTPIAMSPGLRGNRDAHFLTIIGRLRDGASLDVATQQLRAASDTLEARYPDTNKGWGINCLPYSTVVLGNAPRQLSVVSGAAALLLLLVCANVGILVVSRVIRRGGELSTRMALGATRARIAGELSLEIVYGSLAASLGGILVAWIVIRLCVALGSRAVPRIDGMTLDWTTVAFAIAASLAVSLVVTLIAAAFTPSRVTTVRAGGAAGGRNWYRLTSGLVIAVQISLCVTLAAGVVALLGVLLQLRGVNPGFDPAGVATVDVAVPRTKYTSAAMQRRFFADVLDQLRVIPGVTGVAGTSNLPLSGRVSVVVYTPLDAAIPAGQSHLSAAYRVVSPGYFRVMGIAIQQGREFLESDSETSQPVAMVNEALERQMWPSTGALNAHLKLGEPDDKSHPVLTIVGVVRDIKDTDLHSEAAPTIYLPAAQRPASEMTLVLRVAGASGRLVSAVPAAVRRVDPDIATGEVLLMDEVISGSLSQGRFLLWLVGAFGFVAIATAAIGLYSVLSHRVAGSRHDIAVRMALGAPMGTIVVVVCLEYVVAVVGGAIAGVGFTWAIERQIQLVAFGTTTYDARAGLLVWPIVLLAALVAIWKPVIQTVRTDPAATLREG